jgi:hypothetical protein
MALRKTTRLVIIVATIIGLLLAVPTIGVLGAPRGSGSVNAVNVGVYLDSSCKVSCTAIDWGNIKPSDTVKQTVYVKNLGSTVLSLKLSTVSWNPVSAGSLITLSWNVGSQYWLRVGKVLPVTLTLIAAPNAGSLSDFSFAIVITGIQKS